MAAASNPAALGSLFSEKVNRAVELKKKRNFDEAIVLFTELLSARESVAGERDVNALILRDHIGSCLVGAAQYSAAEDYQRETLRRWKRVPSVEGKKKTAHASHELAKTLLKRSDENGDRDGVARMESVQLLKVKLNYLTRGTRERDEGSILNVLDHLAFVLSDLGRFEEAEKVDRDALKSALKIHSGDPEHEQIMDFRLRIADDLAGCGKATEAKVMYEEVLKLLTRRTTETRRSLSAKKLQEYITWCSDGILSMKSAIESAQEEARKRKTEEAKRQAEETKRQAEETKRQAEEAKRQAEENKRRAEEETKRREQEEAEKREEEAEARRKARALKRAEAQKKVEAKRREEEAQKIAEDEKRAEAQRLALEAAQKEAEAREREEARKKKEAKRLADAIVKAEAAKRAEVQKKEEARRIRYRRRRAQKRWQKAIKKVKLILRVIAALKSYRAQGKWRKAFLKVRVTLKVSAVVKAYRVQIRWQRCFVKIKPVIKLASALRSRRAHRKWSQAFTKITLCLKVVAALKALRARRRWHRALRKVSLVLCVAAKAKSIRIRKRWHQAMECALLTVKVISFTVRLRVCARWKKTLAIAMTQAKVTVMVRRLRVRGRWIRATEKVIVRNRLLDRLRSWHSEVVSTRRQRRDDSAIRIPGSWIGAEYGEENRDLIDRQEESELDTDYEEGMQASLYDAQEAER
ncbi:hypothetical protein GQ43DRAFT_269085 [Delitschia confertaspora ATCC 74209]|uniref:Tetratricopeptide repeat protein n=1 Tax=Delitschia confertaspora ATCC 74209 TaxID=1513339 RepID=A0A9P4JB19_9PLEO|nr:hypothetical protein GQ43DRAFT_269085 [Delitschia confertaspora ATCC 74209]